MHQFLEDACVSKLFYIIGTDSLIQGLNLKCNFADKAPKNATLCEDITPQSPGIIYDECMFYLLTIPKASSYNLEGTKRRTDEEANEYQRADCIPQIEQ